MHLMLLGSDPCLALVPMGAKESYSKKSIFPYNCMEIFIVPLFEMYVLLNYDSYIIASLDNGLSGAVMPGSNHFSFSRYLRI